MPVVSVNPTSGSDGDNISTSNTPNTSSTFVRNGLNSGVGTIQVEAVDDAELVLVDSR